MTQKYSNFTAHYHNGLGAFTLYKIYRNLFAGFSGHSSGGFSSEAIKCVSFGIIHVSLLFMLFEQRAELFKVF
jgi:hypothetical protein